MPKRKSSSRRSSTKTQKKGKVEDDNNLNNTSDAESQESLGPSTQPGKVDINDDDNKENEQANHDVKQGDHVDTTNTSSQKTETVSDAPPQEEVQKEEEGNKEEEKKESEGDVSLMDVSRNEKPDAGEESSTVVPDASGMDVSTHTNVEGEEKNEQSQGEEVSSEPKTEQLAPCGGVEKKCHDSIQKELAEGVAGSHEVSMNIVEVNELDATDSQLCIVDESVAKKPKAEAAQGGGENLRSGSEIIKDLRQDLADMNRLITRARNDLNATKARLSTKWQMTF